jgi:hypothetical protein
MANSDKNIIITPFVGGITQPQILFVGQGNDPITLKVLDGVTGSGATAGGGLSVEGSAGQLFSIINRLGTGSIFSVNDISGIPSIDVDANGFVSVAGFTGQVGLGYTGASGAFKLAVNGNAFISGGISMNGQIRSGGQFICGSTAGGFTFSDATGTTTAYLAFYPRISCATTPGGLWMRDGIFQIGGNAFNNLLSSTFYYSPCAERFKIYGNSEFYMDQSYQSSRHLIDLYLGSGHTGEALRVFRGLTHVAGINPLGFLWGSGLSAGASGAVVAGLVTAQAGISAAGITSDSYVLSTNGIRALTGTTYSFLATDNGKILTMNNASGITAAIPTGLPVGFSVTVIQLGAGQVGFSADAGVTLNSYTSLRKIAGQHGSASLVSYSSNVFNLAGNLA